MSTKASKNIFALVETHRTLTLSTGNFSRGINNYHIDVKLSGQFSSNIKTLTALLVSQLTTPKSSHRNNSKLYEKLRDSYLDMMTVLIHRIKTDLKAEEICFLQFAIIKYVLVSVKSRLDGEINTVSSRLAELRSQGSSEALAIDQRAFWLRKNYDSILYSINKQLFSELQRVEERQLDSIRSQYLPEDYRFTADMLSNPLLYVSDLSALSLLTSEYSAWNWSGNKSGFIQLNRELEILFKKQLTNLPKAVLDTSDPGRTANLEIHDELGGLFATQAFLGPAQNCGDTVTENLTWLDIPENVELLFNLQNQVEELKEARKKLHLVTWWRKQANLEKLREVLTKILRLLKSQKILGQLLASYSVRKAMTPIVLESVELKTLCQFLSSEINSKELQASITSSQKLSSGHIKSLEASRDQVKTRVQQSSYEDGLNVLRDISRYRLHLKYHRFAHRAFNRISILTKNDEIVLSKDAGTLYSLPTSNEIEDEQEKICRHAILKADVRRSTIVTEELQRRGLNAASYFSMRFFNPINRILDAYGANKVFIEGDAIILSFLEYANTPQQWFSVARSCGFAIEMLRIVGENNRHSAQMGLPSLELGVGICFSSKQPRFLYDEGKPIMISSAIGLADRMSSCSWKLRQSIKQNLFNVDVLQIADGERERGEKGQQYVRYNVNGILVDNEAFSKLQNEISLNRIKMTMNGKEFCFFVGQFPDMNGWKKDLVIRQGKVGVWKKSKIENIVGGKESYYEVVANGKIIKMVLEANEKEIAAVAG